MNLRKHHFNSFFIGGSLLALIACSGMSPGGGGAPGDVGGPVGGGGALDGSGGSGVGGGSGLPGGPLGDAGGSGGEAVPSTQQSSDSIGGGCARSYQVKVKVLHNGAEEACVAGASARMYGGDVRADTTGTVYDPIDADGDPKVTVTLGYPISQTLTCISGVWQTADPVFFRAVCKNYDVSVVANWNRNGKSHSSEVYQGAPQPPGDLQPIPIDLTIDLGHDSHINHTPFYEPAVNAVD